MAATHTANILKACAELNPGESFVYTFPTEKIAHNEYCYFRTSLRAALQKFPAAKNLTLSRQGSSVTLSMGVPDILYPAPKKVLTSSLFAGAKERSKDDLSEMRGQVIMEIFSTASRAVDRTTEELSE